MRIENVFDVKHILVLLQPRLEISFHIRAVEAIAVVVVVDEDTAIAPREFQCKHIVCICFARGPEESQ